MRERYLIINADDFGMAPCVNKAIHHGKQLGVITSASLLATAQYANEAAGIARLEDLPLGVHWTLQSEWADKPWPMAARNAITLSQNGFLPENGDVAKKAASGDVKKELEAQYQLIKTMGITPSYADCHGTSLYGLNGRLFFITAFELCRKYALPFRFPKGNGFLKRQFDNGLPGPISAAHRVVTLIGQGMGVTLPNEFLTNPYSIARIKDYETLKNYYFQQLSHVEKAVTELVLHPAQPDDNILARSPEWQKRFYEYKLITDGELERFVKQQGFVLTSWREIKKEGISK